MAGESNEQDLAQTFIKKTMAFTIAQLRGEEAVKQDEFDEFPIAAATLLLTYMGIRKAYDAIPPLGVNAMIEDG